MCLFLLPQYCGITILIDVRSNASNREEKKDDGDMKHAPVVSRVVNSSSPSHPSSVFGPHLTVRLPRMSRSNPYVQRFVIGAAHSSRDDSMIASPSSSSMIAAPRSKSPSVGPDLSADPSPPNHELIRIDSDDNVDIQARSSPPDTDNDDGMTDVSPNRNRVSRIDTDNDVDFSGVNNVVDDDMINID